MVLLDLGRVVGDLMLDDRSLAVCLHDPDYAVSTFWHSTDKQAADIGHQSPDVLLQRMIENDNMFCESLAQAREHWQTMFSPVSPLKMPCAGCCRCFRSGSRAIPIHCILSR